MSWELYYKLELPHIITLWNSFSICPSFIPSCFVFFFAAYLSLDCCDIRVAQTSFFPATTYSTSWGIGWRFQDQMRYMIPPADLSVPQGLLPVGCAQNTSTESHMEGVLIKCPKLPQLALFSKLDSGYLSSYTVLKCEAQTSCGGFSVWPLWSVVSVFHCTQWSQSFLRAGKIICSFEK